MKKVNENWDIINKNGHSLFHTTPVNLDILTVLNYLEKKFKLWQCYLETYGRGESMPKKCYGYYSHLLDDRYEASPWSSWTSRQCCRNSSEKLQRGFIIIRMRSYLIKEVLQMQPTGTSFCTFYELIIKSIITIIITISNSLFILVFLEPPLKIRFFSEPP